MLEPHEITNLLSELESPYRLMVLLAVTTGFRRSELFALKWSDVDFSNLTIDIRRAGVMRKIGGHTFRHTYSTMLIANGENVKVVQELMRHSNSRTTLEVYSQARTRAKRE